MKFYIHLGIPRIDHAILSSSSVSKTAGRCVASLEIDNMDEYLNHMWIY